MNNEKNSLRIVKFIVVIICILSIFGRLKIPSKSATLYMIFVNTTSFFIAINLLMYDCYLKLRKKHKTSNDNVIRKIRTWNLVMIAYLLIFVLNIIFVIILYHLYLNTSYKDEILNDILSILSLGFAISTDFLGDFMTHIMWYIVTR